MKGAWQRANQKRLRARRERALRERAKQMRAEHGMTESRALEVATLLKVLEMDQKR